MDPDDGERPREVSLRQRPARERAEEATEQKPSAPDPGRSLAEVVGTIVGDQAPGLVKGLHAPPWQLFWLVSYQSQDLWTFGKQLVFKGLS